MEWLKIIGATLFFIATGYIMLRAMGKKAFTELSTFHAFLIILLIIVLSGPIRSNDWIPTLLSAITILFTYYLYALLQRNNTWRKVLKTKPIMLIRHGNIDEKGLNEAKMTLTQLLAELRLQKITNVQDVEFAILEETGKISVIPTSQKRPLTPNDVGHLPHYEGIPTPVIMDGAIQYDNLALIGLTREQLLQRLMAQGLSEEMLKIVSLGVINEKQELIIDLNDDMNQGKQSQNKHDLITQINESLKAEPKGPEEKDLGIVDDYIKP